ncbi:PAS domain S-box protein [Streptomyces sp. NPDC056488]|uniref:PAS domain S-box protein n=1 Tax=unclassified Streptomyces TaxID=2593676 RepID=UPI0036B40985
MTDGVPPETGGPGAAGTGTDAGRQGTGSLLDLLNVAAVVVDVDGRIVFWSPQATDVFGHTAEEALGRYAARLLLGEEDRHRAVELFATVMTTGRSWAGTFPVLHRDGTTRLVEFRNVRLQDDLGDVYALGIAVDQTTLHDVEDRLAFSDQLGVTGAGGVRPAGRRHAVAVERVLPVGAPDGIDPARYARLVTAGLKILKRLPDIK